MPIYLLPPHLFLYSLDCSQTGLLPILEHSKISLPQSLCAVCSPYLKCCIQRFLKGWLASVHHSSLGLNVTSLERSSPTALWQRWECGLWTSNYRELNWVRDVAAVLWNPSLHLPKVTLLTGCTWPMTKCGKDTKIGLSLETQDSFKGWIWI